VLPNPYGKLSVASTLPPPNPKCLICGSATATLALDLSTFTLQKLVDLVLKKRLAFVSPIVTLENFQYEEGDDLDEAEREENAEHLPTPLAQLPGGGVAHGMRFAVTDTVQDMTVTLVMQHAVRAHSGALSACAPQCCCVALPRCQRKGSAGSARRT
jgi:Ubiquitin/SUMO-activating enzyme ubiquitin-like domain